MAARICALLLIGLAAPACGSAQSHARRYQPPSTTFYVARDGQDSSRGTWGDPWRTVARVNRARLRPGDRVLFEAGKTFGDAALRPGQGSSVSGTAAAPVVFGSYGSGIATLTQGVFLSPGVQYPRGPSHLTFMYLGLGPGNGFRATGDYIALVGLQIRNLLAPASQSETGILAQGSHWLIAGNVIDGTGDSGMLLGFRSQQPGDPPGGYDYLVTRNVVSNTGLDARIHYGTHGIYLKVADAVVSRNRIINFRDDGVSARYRDARIVGNYIAHGSIGIAWFQYDVVPGTSGFIANTLIHTATAGIFVCGVQESCTRPIESFRVERNTLRATGGTSLNLQPTTGRYVIHANTTS